MHPVRINLVSIKATNIGLILLSFLAASCSVPTINTNQYQGEVTTEKSSNQASNGPVLELQRLATSALNQQQYDRSVNYLQRAIKIEPRNAHTWHYLAKSYWHKKNYPQCLDMIQRSYSYSTVEDDLDRANDALKTQCLAD
ncbi:MAG: putative Zn-dependent protease [Urechidicola sp.]|jgi:predicted Zn-dependent protease